MPDFQRLNYLLHLYIDNKLSQAESDELRAMIKSGEYDSEIKDIIDAELSLESGTMDVTPGRAQVLLDKIFISEKQTEALLPGRRSLRRFRKWAAVACLVLLAGGAWMIWSRKGSKDQVASSGTADTLKAAAARGEESGNKRFIQLPDGSTVLLNKDSRLDYGKSYGVATREVVLVGEAYFDIRRDDKHPFTVHTGKVHTMVLGTAFNVRAYPGQQDIRITVTRGKVRVAKDEQVLGTVTPNQQIAVNTSTNDYSLSPVNAETEVVWKKQFLVLDDITMGEAAALIGDKYHIHILFANEVVRSCRISATFLNNETLEQVLTVICGVTGSSYTMQPNDQVVVSGKGCQ